MVLPRWTKRTAAASVTLPASLLAFLGTADSPVSAQVVAVPGPSLRVSTPKALVADQFDLDVAYESQSGAAVTGVEVWVDGVRWHRHTPAAARTRGTFRFELAASSLPPGAHSVVVKVFDARNARSETAVQLVTGNDANPEEAVAGPSLRFVAPGNEKTVSGTVELSVEAKDRSGENPYVSFFVDDEFKTLKNFPPYSYSWDTTRAANGWHTVEAVGHGGASTEATRRRLRVYVDNPGGATVRQPDIPDLRPAPVHPARVLTIPLPKALPGARSSAPARKAPTVRVASAHWKTYGLPVAAPETVTPGTEPRQHSRVPTVTTAAGKTRGGVRSAALHGVPAPSPFSVRPTVAAPVGKRVSARPAAPPVRVTKAPARKPVPATPKKNVPLQVAFDGERIAFDVPPRVEAGLPLAPFRQIFEHTGGVVTWVPATRVVRAVNADREIVFAVGKRDARVNDRKVTMERAATLSQGRTIVPLSFVGRALDVDIQYDPATGRLQITRK